MKARPADGRRPKRRLRAPRQLRITRAGWYYLALTVGTGIAGLNTGNNLVFLSCGLMLGLVIASGILSERSLRGLTVRRLLPATMTCGRPTVIGLSVRNAKSSTSFGILIEDLAVGGRCQFPLLRACEAEERSYPFIPERRGRHDFSTVRIATRFPFGLFEKSLELELPEALLARPAPLPYPIPERGSPGRRGDAPARTDGAGTEPWQLRAYRDGEDARLIAWGPSARAGRPLALDRERAESRVAELALPDAAPEERFERLVSEAAFAAEALTGRGLSLSLRQGERRLVAPGAGSAQLGRLLDALAGLERSGLRPSPVGPRSPPPPATPTEP